MNTGRPNHLPAWWTHGRQEDGQSCWCGFESEKPRALNGHITRENKRQRERDAA